MSDKRPCIFVSPLVSEEIRSRFDFSTAANNFSSNLVSGGHFDEIFTYLTPIVDGSIDIEPIGPNNMVFYSKRWRSNRFKRKFAFIKECFDIYKRLPKHSNIWLYNLPYTLMPLFFLTRIFRKKTKLYLILLDFTPNQGGIRTLFNKFELFCFNKFDGIIELTNIKQIKAKNISILPGVTPKVFAKWPEINIVNRAFLISGALGDNIAMLPRLLLAFSKLPNYTLHITGKPLDTELVNKYTDSYPNIIYHGQVSYEEYLRILHSSPFLLSTRNPTAPENQCNFPSKIIEGLLHNRIIISTIDYPQLNPIKYLKVDADNLENDLRKITSMSDNSLLEYANQAELTDNMFNAKRWAKEMERIETKGRL